MTVEKRVLGMEVELKLQRLRLSPIRKAGFPLSLTGVAGGRDRLISGTSVLQTPLETARSTLWPSTALATNRCEGRQSLPG